MPIRSEHSYCIESTNELVEELEEEIERLKAEIEELKKQINIRSYTTQTK